MNLREAPIRSARDGTPQNPGAGGWPTLRYFNKETGPGGAPVERKTAMKICDEFKDPTRMTDAVRGCMKVCDAKTGEGCDDAEKAFFDAWKGKDKVALAAELARVDDLLSPITQKKLQGDRNLLAKLAAVQAEGEL